MGQAGVTVQGDDKADVGQLPWLSNMNQRRRTLEPGSVNEAVEFFQFAAFSFPTDIFLFRLTPPSLTVKKKKMTAAMAHIHRFNSCNSLLQKSCIVISFRGVCIRVVCEQTEK